MSLKPSIGQIVNPFFLQDGQDANPSAYTPPYLKTGGASWSGTGLVYDVTALEYYFNGDKLTAATQVTLDASDPTYNRLDAIVVDEAGVVSVIKGDASASPISPSVDESHILIQYILVEAGSTQPTIAKEDIYLENVEWTTSTYTTGTATGSIDFDNAVSPKQGVKCISANADARLGARFVRTTSFDPYQYTMLSMWVRFTGSNVATNKSLNVRFENGAGTLVANTINLFNFGLQRNLLNVWQLVVIPITSFGTLPTSVKGLKIIMTGGTVGQARQWDIDLISLTDNSVPSINEQAFNVLKDGALVGQSSTINFKGAPVTVTNDPINKKIDVEVTAVSYPLNVADGVKGGSSALDPLSLDIEGLPTGALATTTELAINNGTVNEKTTLSDLATFLDNRDVYSVADITALNAITGMDTGDVAIVADTFDLTGEHVAGSYVYDGTNWLLESRYAVTLNNLLDVNAPSPVAGDVLQWDGTTWVNVANAFAPLNGTPTEVRYFGNTGVSTSDPLFTRDEVTNHTKAVRDYNSQSIINTATVPVQFLTQNTNGTFNIGDQVETRFGEAQAEVLDVGTATTTEPQYTNLVYSGVGLNDLTSIYVGGYSGSYPVSYTVEVLQNNVAYSGIGGVNGTLSIGDTITGLSSGATAVIVAIDTFKNILAVDTIIGTFIPSETVQGNTPSDFISIGGDFSTLADIVLISNTNANSIITTIAPTSQLEGVETSFSSFTGHTIGDTRTFDISPTTISTIVYLTNITGTLPIGSNTRLNNLTTPFQTDDGNIFAAQFTIGDTVDVIDLSAGFTQVGQINITQVSGQTFTYTLNSGTIAIGNYLYGPSIDKVGFVYNLTSNIVNKTINTGFRTEPIQFPNVPFIIEGSAIVATDGVDKMAVGVLDLSELSAGIVAFYGDSSQSTFTTKKGVANLNIFDSTTNKYLDVNYYMDEFTIQGYNNITDFGLSINGNRLSYKTNGTQFTFPTSIGGIGYVVADVNGNGVLTLEPISSLIGPITNIYNSDGTLTSNREVYALGLDIKFSGTNLFNEQWNIGTITNYEGTIFKTTGFSNGSLGLIKAQSLGYEDTQYIYKLYNGIGDFSEALPNKARTLYTHDGNIGISTINTKLVESTSSNAVYDETIVANGSNIIGTKTSSLVTNSSQINESYDVLTGEFLRTIGNIFNSNTYQQTRTDFLYSSYGNTRDDSGITTPVNFIYTDGSGKFLSAPLADPYEIIIDMKTANYTVVAADQGHIIHIDNSGGAIDITLPDPSTVRVGRPFKFKAVGNSANTVRFLPFASENIDLSVGAYTWSNPLGLQALEVYTDGINWFIS